MGAAPSTIVSAGPLSPGLVVTLTQFLNNPAAHIQATSPYAVPKLLWRTGPYPLHKAPLQQKAAMATFAQMAPGWLQVYATDTECRHFLQTAFPGAPIRAYDAVLPSAYKADIWRLFVLLQYGGLYADIGYQMMRPLASFFNADEDQFLTAKDRSTDGRPRVLQALLGAYPRHHVIAAMADAVLKRVEARALGVDPQDVTGPTVVGPVVTSALGMPQAHDSLPVGRFWAPGPPAFTGVMLHHPPEGGSLMVEPGQQPVFLTKFPDYAKVMYDGRGKTSYIDLWRDKPHEVFAKPT
jgi:hypothetical protein